MLDIKHLKPIKNGRYKLGYINPNSCKKLFSFIKGTPIIYRSSYESKFIYWLENNKNVKFWGSECLEIPYYSLLDKKTHKYYPDYFIEMQNGDKYVIEVKPYNLTQKPINENSWASREYIRNRCKWSAAVNFCKIKGFKFKILTEKTINYL